MEMKRTLATLLAVVLLVGTVFALSGCDGTKETATPADGDKGVSIVGAWEYESGGYTYTFNEDGTGQYDVAGTVMPFTYEIDGENLSILYEGNTAAFETTFEIKGGTLNIIDSLGNDTLYKKVK